MRKGEQTRAAIVASALDLSARVGLEGLTIGALVFSLMFGTVAFMGSLAFGIQRYFEYQIEEAKKISQ